jgi:hypothetical protein
MALRDTARLAVMSDPERNRWFTYRWVLPLLPERKSPSAPKPRQPFANRANDITNTARLAKAQAQAFVGRLFAPRQP